MIIRHIPNTITCCNLISGAIATMFAFEGNAIMALTFIIIGAVFDFFDGFAARMLNVSSPIGKELDSLADDITFGLAPSALVFTFLTNFAVCEEGLGKIIPYSAFLIAAFSALRLAKFNLDERQTSSFLGLPTPANALFWGAFVIGWGDSLLSSDLQPWTGLLLVVVMVLLSSWLLVSEIPMFALKFKNFKLKDNRLRYLFLITAILTILFFQIKGVAVTILWYILLSLFTQKK